jgi:ABC-2 type transport system ATP-binding protein
MISVRNLTKRYADLAAIADLTFDVEPGEVVGFLGPNGAGKTTTLRILTGFMPATSGSAQVAGLDVLSDSIRVRERVGYLPENVPLYPEMRVHEYLTFRARLKGVPRSQVQKRLADVLQKCGLVDMRQRIVGQLSKGYRQRVGLADTLIHNPPILLLDEPTAGLDPNQRKEVRDLIAALRAEHTILLSSHILAEIESISNRVLIIKKGKRMAFGTTAELIKQLAGGNRIRIEAQGERPVLESTLKGIPQVQGVTFDEPIDGYQGCRLEVQTGADIRQDVVGRLIAARIPFREVHWEKLTLEELFLRITVESAIPAEVSRVGAAAP